MSTPNGHERVSWMIFRAWYEAGAEHLLEGLNGRAIVIERLP
jgi:hypothetical protein